MHIISTMKSVPPLTHDITDEKMDQAFQDMKLERLGMRPDLPEGNQWRRVYSLPTGKTAVRNPESCTLQQGRVIHVVYIDVFNCARMYL